MESEAIARYFPFQLISPLLCVRLKLILRAGKDFILFYPGNIFLMFFKKKRILLPIQSSYF